MFRLNGIQFSCRGRFREERCLKELTKALQGRLKVLCVYVEVLKVGKNKEWKVREVRRILNFMNTNIDCVLGIRVRIAASSVRRQERRKLFFSWILLCAKKGHMLAEMR